MLSIYSILVLVDCMYLAASSLYRIVVATSETFSRMLQLTGFHNPSLYYTCTLIIKKLLKGLCDVVEALQLFVGYEK